MSEQPTIYVIYNAKASLLGKITYGYKKLSASADKSPCAACDLTHGGLKLDESAEWKETKQKIPAKVEQLHQDELAPELSDFVKTNQIRYPVILGRKTGESFKVLLTAEDLSSVSRSHQNFLALLKERAQDNQIPLTASSNL